MSSSRVKTLLVASAMLTIGIIPAFAQSLQFQFGRGQFRFERTDPRSNVQGKRASCEVYARIAVVQAEANRQFRCRYEGARWGTDAIGHFRWCRYAQRSELHEESRARGQELQECFDKLGDFDERR